ncbi:hypothetical protein J4H92_03265 [Leucobacter weissii]|uniref:Uncharacterized protein n=1 Tax=Leucobacter weissii TaxID=1983706 RepID=A0A939MLR9_9MICO|nr:hypothetical protein [Leucobacter weissii]MBO1900967.1 hypothetical protein [Leucobacter weissii]
MAGFWGRRDREEEARLAAADSGLALRARTALVTADERIRVTQDELAFAVAELGEPATAELRVGLEAVREHLTEAFQLHQLNHDEIPDTAEELRTRNARIVQLCEWAEEVLDERTEPLKAKIERVRAAPQLLAGIRRETAELQQRLPQMRETIARLQRHYSEAALQRVRITADEAERVLEFALHSADVAERRRAAGRNEEANLALETAIETVRRADAIIDGVDEFEIEAMRAQSTLAEVIADSRGDLIAAAGLSGSPPVAEAMRGLEAALGRLASGGAASDPFADLAALSGANAALDEAVARARERAARPLPSIEHVRHDLAAADRALGVASGLINGHRGWIGADARTRFAEAQRIRTEIEPLIPSEETREEAQQLARRVAQLAGEAVQLAQRDIDSSRPDDDDWGPRGGRGDGPRGGRGGSPLGDSGNILGPVLGGVILGGLLGEIFD